MTPLAFDDDTCREVAGDAQSRSIEAKARSDADINDYKPPAVDMTGSYWAQVTSTMEMYVYIAAYKKRIARLERVKENQQRKP